MANNNSFDSYEKIENSRPNNFNNENSTTLMQKNKEVIYDDMINGIENRIGNLKMERFKLFERERLIQERINYKNNNYEEDPSESFINPRKKTEFEVENWMMNERPSIERLEMEIQNHKKKLQKFEEMYTLKKSYVSQNTSNERGRIKGNRDKNYYYEDNDEMNFEQSKYRLKQLEKQYKEQYANKNQTRSFSAKPKDNYTQSK